MQSSRSAASRFSGKDLIVLLMANAGVIGATGDAAPDAWRRLVGYMLQAFSAANSEPLPPAPRAKVLFRAMVHAQYGRLRSTPKGRRHYVLVIMLV